VSRLSFVSLLLFALVSAPAAAQRAGREEGAPRAGSEDAAERARAYFNEGLALADRGDWPSAVEQFEQALALRDAPSIRINLAVSLSHLGRLTEALEHLDGDLSAAPAELRQQAHDLRVEIEPRVGRLVPRVREPDPSCVVIAGRRELPSTTLEPIAFDPGSVTVRLVCSGVQADSVEVVVPEGGAAHVVLARAPGAAIDTTPPSTSGSDDTWLWVGVGLGAAALVGAAVAVGVVLSQPSHATGDFDPPTLTFGLAGAM
jgi:hypothetical protein